MSVARRIVPSSSASPRFRRRTKPWSRTSGRGARSRKRARRLAQEGRIRPAETSDGSRCCHRPSPSPRDAHVQRPERLDDPDQGLAQIGAHAAGHRRLERAIITSGRPFRRLSRRGDRLDQSPRHPAFYGRVPIIRVREQRRHRRRHDRRQQRHHKAALVRLPKPDLLQQIRRFPVGPGSVDRTRLSERTRRRQQHVAGAADEIHAVAQRHAAIVALGRPYTNDVAIGRRQLAIQRQFLPLGDPGEYPDELGYDPRIVPQAFGPRKNHFGLVVSRVHIRVFAVAFSLAPARRARVRGKRRWRNRNQSGMVPKIHAH